MWGRVAVMGVWAGGAMEAFKMRYRDQFVEY